MEPNNIENAPVSPAPQSQIVQTSPPSSKNKLLLILIVLAFLFLTLGGGAYYYLEIKNKIDRQEKPCPAIARICNDGSTAKPGPNCTQSCPEDSTSPTPTPITKSEITPKPSCGTCPQFMPPSLDFCKDGTVIPGKINECGCQLPPTCKR